MAFVSSTDGVTAVPARIYKYRDAALVVADDYDAVFAHEVEEEVAGVRDLRLVAHEEPGAGEDLLHLELIDLRVVEQPAVDRSLLNIDEPGRVPSQLQL